MTRVIVFGFDGLRADMLRPDLTPNLARLAASGTRFANARSVFPSETRAALPSIATGCRPGSHGMVANTLWAPEVEPARTINTKESIVLDRMVEATGRFLDRPGIGGRLAQAGKRMAVVGTGSTGATQALAAGIGPEGFVWHPDQQGRHAEAIASRFGAPPAAGKPNAARTTHAARVFVEHVLDELRPDFALLWSSEPDVSFHYAGIGDGVSLAALREADAALGRIIDWRDRQPDAADIVVAAVSDHGHVTGHRRFDLMAELAAAPLRIARQAAPGVEAILGAGGGPGLWLQGEGDRTDRAAALAAWLAAQPWAGLVLSRHDLPGTVPLDTFGPLHARSPDLAVTFVGDGEADAYGLPGRVLIEAADVPQGGGMHGGLQAGELATVLVLSGGPVGAGAVVDTPADLSDIAPTLLALLGMGAEGCDGRALAEAWGKPAPTVETVRLQASAGRALVGRSVGGRFYADGAGS